MQCLFGHCEIEKAHGLLQYFDGQYSFLFQKFIILNVLFHFLYYLFSFLSFSLMYYHIYELLGFLFFFCLIHFQCCH